MATYFVGQRVRVKRAYFPENINATGVITKMFPECASAVEGWIVNCEVVTDRRSRGQYAHTCDLEPIINDGLEACDDDFKRDLDRLLERQGIAA